MSRLVKTFRPIKRALASNPALYHGLYDLVTRNADYAALKRDIDLYPSAFGGMWTDRHDFESYLARKTLSSEQEADARQWREQGYLIRRGAVSPERIDAYMAEIEALAAQPDHGLLLMAEPERRAVPYSAQAHRTLHSARLLDDYALSQASRDMMFDPSITDFLDLVFERPAMLTQTLRFEVGSRQPVHQDTAFVRMNSPMKLVGVWIALEDIQPGSGELVYYPGSHLWEGELFSGRFKHYEESRDGREALMAWHRWIDETARDTGAELQHFSAKKGDVLFWHAGLVHGGGEVVDDTLTRRSMVGHYCPEGVRPIYHYYAPAQRKIKGPPGRRYTSSQYR